MYETEEFSEGWWIIHRPDGKVVGKINVTASGNGKQEDWHLVTSVPPGNSTHAVYIWPSSGNPDVTMRFERSSSEPSFPTGTGSDVYRHQADQI